MMAADPEGLDKAVGGNGLGTADNQRVLLQELHMMQNHINQMYNPNPEPEKQSHMLKNSETTYTTSAARRKPSARRRKGNSPKGEKASVTARGRQVPFRTVTWNVAGLAEDSLEPFLACARKIMLWDVMFLQETFRKLEGLPTEECNTFTPGTLPGQRHRGWRCPAIIVQNRISDECRLAA